MGTLICIHPDTADDRIDWSRRVIATFIPLQTSKSRGGYQSFPKPLILFH